MIRIGKGDGAAVAVAWGRGPGMRARALVELTKPGMVFHILITAFVGYLAAADGGLDWGVILITLCGTGLQAASAFAFNQAMEKPYDLLMARTRARPLPSERLSPRAAYAFGVAAFTVGTVALAWRANLLTASLGALTVFLYACVYTPMKRYSSLNTLVGAIPGALPPLMGWAAAQGRIGLGGMVLFTLLFLWQLPHFLAIAWMYRQDYRDGGFRMLSVTDPTGEACFRHILLQTAVLVVASFLPYLLGMAGWAYLACALLAGGYFLKAAAALYRRRTREAARAVFFTSLVYLPVVLLALAAGRAWALR